MENLAIKTNGSTYFIKDNDYSKGLTDALIGSQLYTPALPVYQIAVVVLFHPNLNLITYKCI